MRPLPGARRPVTSSPRHSDGLSASRYTPGYIIIYVLSASFILMAAALAFAYHRTRHTGMLVMATTYAVSGGLALLIPHWWPLAAGFALVWAFKLLGLDPGTKIQSPEEGK